jgi:hypothetical protein
VVLFCTLLQLFFRNPRTLSVVNVGNQLDPNKQALKVIKKGINNGNPKWTWAGSD